MRRSLLLVGMLVSCAAAVDSGERPRGLERRAAAALEEFRAAVPAGYFNEAHAYAVLPLVTRFGVGLGERLVAESCTSTAGRPGVSATGRRPPASRPAPARSA